MESWGLGKVVAVTADGKLQIRFQGRPDLALLAQSAANAFLVGDESATWQEAPKHSTKAPGVKCSACNRVLRRAFKSADGKWKSCPECSGRDGAQHVFKPYPDAFGLSPARMEAGVEDGTQSWCEDCRGAQRGGAASGASTVPTRRCEAL